jgi:hypothetical protein
MGASRSSTAKEGAMFETSSACASTPSPTLQAGAGWQSEQDDYALGCECADPSLQIDCWGQDREPHQAGGPAS